MSDPDPSGTDPSGTDASGTDSTDPRAPWASVRGPQTVPTVAEALLSRGQAEDHARTAGADADQRSQAVRGLIRAQLRLALILSVGFFCAVVLTSLLLVTTGLGSITLWGVPLAWVVPGVGFFPALLGLAWYFRRRAEANEQMWADVLGLSLHSSDTRVPGTRSPDSHRPGARPGLRPEAPR